MIYFFIVGILLILGCLFIHILHSIRVAIGLLRSIERNTKVLKTDVLLKRRLLTRSQVAARMANKEQI